MHKTVTIFINEKPYTCLENESVLKVAIDNKVEIPHFCYHEDLAIEANCRTCLVQDADTQKIATSCDLRAKEGLKVITKSPLLEMLRKKNQELLLLNHTKGCPKCKGGYFCKVKEKIDTLGLDILQYSKIKTDYPIHKLGTAAELDPNICISCNSCAKICEKIGIGYLHLEGKGASSHIESSKDPLVDCIYCGQCTVHCPVGAAREQNHLTDVEKALKDKSKIVIVQMAPSIRASIGEEFGGKPGQDVTGQMYTALRKVGFDKIFDVNMGADITTIVEAEELIDRIKNGGVLPLFTSCCPAWVKFIEYYHPEFIPNLTTSRSPQMHSGAAYKTWWAEKEKIDPKKIVVVSIMPCTSKKYEARNEKFKVNGMNPVDYVLTTRETALLLKKHNINPLQLKPSKVDHFGEYSGAATIYGASGGVMESALRTAVKFITGEDLKKLEFESVRGIEGIKRTTVQVGTLRLKIAVVSTPKNARVIIEELKKNPKAYDYVEVMACPGGCIGGGGQPIPTTDRIVEERSAGLYSIDTHMKMRLAHENPVVKDFFEYVNKLSHEKKHGLLHTHYSKKNKGE